MQRTNANYKQETIALTELKEFMDDYQEGDVTAILADFSFRPHKQRGFIATSEFENGFGMSVLPENDNVTYEVAILRNGMLDYRTGITEDVLRFQSVDNVHRIAMKVRNLPEGYRVDLQ